MRHPEIDSVELAITASLIAGDTNSAFKAATDLLDQGKSFEEVLFGTLMSTERDLGQRWQGGDYLVTEEHIATATLESVIALLGAGIRPDPDALSVSVAAAEGDLHSLPGRAVATFLAHQGFKTVFLGANTLATDLGEYLASAQPDALVLSCAMTNHLVGARAAIEESHRHAIPVVVGGHAFGEMGTWAPLVGADAWVAEPGDLPEVLTTWTPDTEISEEIAATPPPDLIAIRRKRESILANAVHHHEQETGQNPDRRDREEFNMLLNAVATALLIGDYQAVSDVKGWQRVTLSHHGHDGADLIVSALDGALAEAGLDQARLALTTDSL